MTSRQVSTHSAEKRLVWNPDVTSFAAPSKALRKSPRFIKGPLPLLWVQQAARLPGKALHVALELWHAIGFNNDGSRTVILSSRRLADFGVSRDAKYDALRRLERAGLVAVERSPGRLPRVTLLKEPGQDYGD